MTQCVKIYPKQGEFMKNFAKETFDAIKGEVWEKVKNWDMSKAYAVLQIPTVRDVQKLEKKVEQLEKKLKAKGSKVA